MKVLEKQKMVSKNVASFIMNERNILQEMNCDFLVRGVYSFQNKENLYMVMEYMKGGDMGSILAS